MTQLRGAGVGLGIVRGPVCRMAAPQPPPGSEPGHRSPAEEHERATRSMAAVAADLEDRAGRTAGTAADVLEAQAMMAEDETLADEVRTRIDAGSTAERAVHEAFASFRQTLAEAGGYLAERSSDLDDVAARIIADLRGMPAPGIPDPGHPFVLVARDLAPADTALLDLDRVLAIVTAEGGPTSHTAILAREKGLVAVVGVADASSLADGIQVIVDAAGGSIDVAPDARAIEAADRRIAERRAAAALPPSPGALADGTPVPLLANLGAADAAADAIARGAEGVGLFRTEFLFLSAQEAPSVDAQRTEYAALLEAFRGRKVVVRLLDAGADKPLAFLTDGQEDNPALGVRGIRALRRHEDVLRTQLAALAAADADVRASGEPAELWVMAPMVATAEEAAYVTSLAAEHGLRMPGVMVEVPSSALIADRILAETGFASIGTNDLTQYTLAADRLLGATASYQDPWHPAVLDLVGRVGEAGRRLGKPVGICGEAAADPLLAVVLIGLGATSLSMAPAALSDVRTLLRTVTADDARRAAAAALAAADAASARSAAHAATSEEKEVQP